MMRTIVEPDGVVLIMELAEPPAPTAVERVAITRATTSSRTPGRLNIGTVYIAKPVLEVCRHCGRMRRGTTHGAHAPHLVGDGSPRIVDCVGVPCVKGADGYQHRVDEAKAGAA